MLKAFRKFSFPDAKIWGFVYGPERPSGMYLCLKPCFKLELFFHGHVVSLSRHSSFRRVKDFGLLFENEAEAWRSDPANEEALRNLLYLMWEVHRGMPPPDA